MRGRDRFGPEPRAELGLEPFSLSSSQHVANSLAERMTSPSASLSLSLCAALSERLVPSASSLRAPSPTATMLSVRVLLPLPETFDFLRAAPSTAE